MTYSSCLQRVATRRRTERRSEAEERTRLRIAIAHDYLTQRGGAERVVLALAKMFPHATIYTTLYEPSMTYPEFEKLNVVASGLNRIPQLRRNHRAALPLLPAAVRSLHIDADVVLCSSSGWAHAVRTTGRKVVYCYSPARWLYQSDTYLGESAPRWLRLALMVAKRPLIAWDKAMAREADTYVAISSVVRDRVRSTYGMTPAVIPAPCDDIAQREPEEVDLPPGPWRGETQPNFYLCVSRLLPYKNVHEVVGAFRNTRRNLIVVGRGPEEEALKLVAPSNVLFLKDLSEGQIAWLYQNCRGVIAASYEDFGLTPLEGATLGKPTAALRWGGFLDTIVESKTGVYFDEPTADQISAAVDVLETRVWSPEIIRSHARKFSQERFKESLEELLHG
ncbi:glycosyltransferase [Rhodococcoides kroppenstedtii]|uniref:glycosyltransferase n=1 Tax=Rhodococcoides kroppenstedtii TaxID=293050 RepID=UPI00362912C8